MNKKRVKRFFTHSLEIIIGSLMVALSINLFFLENKIAPGGVSGLATVLYYLTNISMGTIVIALNIPLFAIGILSLGKKFGAKTLVATVIMSIAIDYTSFLPLLTDDLLLASIFGGALMGSGLAVVFRAGATTGGTDIAAKVVNKWFPSLQISEQLFLIDALVVIFATVVFQNFDIGFYSILTIFISAKVIDIIFEGIGFSKALFIISDYGEEIGQKILTKVKRGVTALNGEGMYTGKEKKIILTVVDRRQIPKIKRIAKAIDDKAFIIVTDVREALGEGFGLDAN